MTQNLWLNPVFGVAGDMLLGALLGVGASEDQVRSNLATLEVDGWALNVEMVTRRGLISHRADVTAQESNHRRWSEIDGLISRANIPDQVKDGARSTFRVLAAAEAKRHGVEVDEVEFHEVGAVDAVVDIVGSWAALVSLDVTSVISAPIGLGAGAVSAAHGGLPHPAPAVLELLKGLPVTSVDTTKETATPTGVALLKTMVDTWGSIPDGVLQVSGFGAGGRDPESHANVLAASLVEDDSTSHTDATLIESNVDDVTPEVIGYLIDRLLELGADDAWVVPVVMKKGRPGHEIRVLCTPGLVSGVLHVIASETGSLGARSTAVTKTVYPRSSGSVTIEGHPVGIKIGPHGIKPEYEDLKTVAQATGRPMKEIREAALEEWLSRQSI